MIFEDIVSFLNDRAPDLKCDACGHDDWMIAPHGGNEDKVLIPIGGGQGDLIKGEYHMFIAVCKYCGQCKFFHTDVINRWLESRAKG